MVTASGEGWDLLGWHPQWRPEAVAETVNWYRSVVPGSREVA